MAPCGVTTDGITTKLYVDGVEVTSDGQSGASNVRLAEQSIGHIGGRQDNASSLTGSMKDVKMWGQVLPPSVVLSEFEAIVQPPDLSFKTTWKTTGSAETITLPFSGTNSFDVDWDDGSAIETVTTANPTHEYANVGEYTVSCIGTATDPLAGVENMTYMFNYCDLMTSLDVTSFDTSLVTNFGNMFSDASSLTSLDVTNWNTSNVDNLNSMFNLCSTYVQLMFNLCSTYVQLMFNLCSAITDITGIENFDTSMVDNMGNTFAYCPQLNPVDVSSWNIELVTTMYDFYGGSSVWSTVEYDKALVSFSLQTVQPNVTLRVGTVQYDNAPARLILTDPPNNWIITDGGSAPS